MIQFLPLGKEEITSTGQEYKNNTQLCKNGLNIVHTLKGKKGRCHTSKKKNLQKKRDPKGVLKGAMSQLSPNLFQIIELFFVVANTLSLDTFTAIVNAVLSM